MNDTLILHIQVVTPNEILRDSGKSNSITLLILYILFFINNITSRVKCQKSNSVYLTRKHKFYF